MEWPLVRHGVHLILLSVLKGHILSDTVGIQVRSGGHFMPHSPWLIGGARSALD